MELRSLFSRIFGNDKSTVEPSTASEFTLLDSNKAVFTPYKGNFQYEPDVIKCVDAIARNGAKMHPIHMRKTKNKIERLDDNLYRLLSKRPNEIQNAYQFYYQVIYNLEMFNDSFIYIQRDANLNVTGLYPLDFSEGKLYEYNDKIYIKFKFGRGKERFVPYDKCIHLTRFTSKNGLSGGSSVPIVKALSFKHILDEGIINAIKTTQSIKGVVKSTKAMLKPEDVKKMVDQFVDDFRKAGNNGGIGGLDATTDFTPVEIKPTVASDKQIESIDNKILSYYGVSEEIIMSKYTEDQWNAFYESILEPIGIQMSMEFTNKVFTPTEIFHGNEIIFECNALQYASNKTKIELLRYASNVMYVDELREVLNLGPLPNGEGQKILIDQNHTSNLNTDDDSKGGDNNEGN